MKKSTNTIFNFLHGLTYLSFYGSILILGLMFVVEFTRYDLKWGSFSIKPLNKNGYSIPVNMTITNKPDTFISINVKTNNGELSTGYSSSESKERGFHQYNIDSLLKLDSVKTKMYLYKWVAVPMPDNNITGWGGKDNYELFENGIKRRSIDVSFESIHETVQIKAKGKNKWQNLILAFESYFNVIMWIFVCYQLLKIFNSLHSKLSFVENLHKRIKIIGLIIISSQLILFAYGFVYLQIFGSITLDHAFPPDENYNGVFMQFNPTSSANFSYVLVGLALLVLSQLFQYGQQLQKENDLTI
jgi:Protein of unknown function (DUF2975)